MIPPAVYVTVAIFMAGVIFALGQGYQRLAHLETWRGEMLAALNDIHKAIRRLELLLKERPE